MLRGSLSARLSVALLFSVIFSRAYKMFIYHLDHNVLLASLTLSLICRYNKVREQVLTTGDPGLVGFARTPLVDLPLGATEDRVCGTIDFERALMEGKKKDCKYG